MPTVVITGANRGLGLEFARQYAAAGWTVIATARMVDQATALIDLARVKVLPLDVANPEAIKDFAVNLDGVPVDLLINNAGIFGPAASAQSQASLDSNGWVETLRVNGLGPVLMSLALAPNLARAAAPVVATITSLMGSIGDNSSSGYYAYRMSKAAVNMGMKNLSMDLSDRKIAVVTLHPGWVQTDMGGPQAPLKAPESVTGMRKVIAETSMGNTGEFKDYRGQSLPW